MPEDMSGAGNSNGKIKWVSEKRKVEELIPSNYNPRKFSDKEWRKLARSIEKFDLCDPLIINTNNHLIGGHFRLKILKQRGALEADVRVPNRELNEAEEKELNIRLNKNLGEWDFNVLADWDRNLLLESGFETPEVNKILATSRIMEEVVPEIEFAVELKEEHNYIVLYFDNEVDWLQGQELFELKKQELKYRVLGMANSGLGRVIKGSTAIQKILKYAREQG